MRYNILIAFAALMLSGCQSTHYQFNDRKLLESEYAKLRPLKKFNGWQPRISSYITVVDYENKKKWKELQSFWAPAPQKVNLTPNKYLIIFECNNGSSHAFPSVFFEFEGGKVYSARCFNSVDSKVGVEIKEAIPEALVM